MKLMGLESDSVPFLLLMQVNIPQADLKGKKKKKNAQGFDGQVVAGEINSLFSSKQGNTTWHLAW